MGKGMEVKEVHLCSGAQAHGVLRLARPCGHWCVVPCTPGLAEWHALPSFPATSHRAPSRRCPSTPFSLQPEVLVPDVSTSPQDPTVVLITLATGCGVPSHATATVVATYTTLGGYYACGGATQCFEGLGGGARVGTGNTHGWRDRSRGRPGGVLSARRGFRCGCDKRSAPDPVLLPGF